MAQPSIYGLKGQSMAGPRASVMNLLAIYDYTSGSGTVTAPETCTALVFAYGPGMAGQGGASTALSGTGGGALMKRVPIGKGQQLSYSVGAPGTDTVVTLPGGARLIAQTGGATLGGGASGGDVNRTGGSAIQSTASNNGTGETPSPGGGTGGSGLYNPGSGQVYAGGAGGAGFGDIGTFLRGGAGGNGSNSNGAAGSNPGGGGGGGQGGSGGAGANGRVVVLFINQA